MSASYSAAVGEARVPALVAAAAAVGLAVSFVLSPHAAWPGVLAAGVVGLHVALGAGFLAAISLASGARWWDGLQGVVRGVGASGWVAGAALLVVFVAGLDHVYAWAGAAHDDAQGVVHGAAQAKAAWLNRPFFLARAALLLFLFWASLRWVFGVGAGGVARACGFLVAVGWGLSVASWDWIMSIDAAWFSTLFGVYAFAGAMQGGIAAVVVLAHWPRGGAPGPVVSAAQRHDLGKLLFAFSMFWAYIWFCQYMLIWYAHIPEETAYFAARLRGPWPLLFWLNPVLNFVVPFVLLLSARAKRHAFILSHVAALLLIGRWLDVALLVAPSHAQGSAVLLPALSATACVAFVMWRSAFAQLGSALGGAR